MNTLKRLCAYTTVVLVLLIASCSLENKNVNETNITTDSNRIKEEGTEQMIDSLNAIYKQTNFRGHPYSSLEMVEILRSEIETAQKQGTLKINDYFGYAWKLLDAGKTKESIDVYNNIFEQVPATQEINSNTKGIYQSLAIAYLRLAEQENCIENHSEESCIFPIQGKGIHTKKESAKKAIKLYTKLLTQFPDDLQSLWLLNIAYMTIGEYPSKVPKKWLIPPSSFSSEFDLLLSKI